MSSRLNYEMALAEQTAEALRGMQAGTLPVSTAIEVFQVANRVALENSVRFPAAGPMNDARAAVCAAFRDLIAAIVENRPRNVVVGTVAGNIEVWKRNLVATLRSSDLR